jgi:hypothetical protein
MYRMSFRRRSVTDVKMPRAMTPRSIFENHNSTWSSHAEYVGVKWSCSVGWAARKVRTF